jgi:hypothetical protein
MLGCNRDKGVTISGNVPGLDTLGYRGDSLVAWAERRSSALRDSLQLLNDPTRQKAGDTSVDRTDPIGGAVSGPPSRLTAGQEMSRRAQARGDSMARAIAQRLAGADSGDGGARRDSLRGIVTLIGVEPARVVVLRAEGIDVTLSGMAATSLRRRAGTEVAVRGVKVTPRDIVVRDYVVRASGGVPAWDGTLEDGGELRLSDGTGRKRLPSVPGPLRGLVGTRVWVAFKPGSVNADSYGIIGRR